MGKCPYGKFLLLLVLAIGWVGCAEDKEEPGQIGPTINHTTKTNEWIYEEMSKHYLWYDELPEKSTLNLDQNPETFFKSLLSDKDGREHQGQHQYFSRIKKKEDVLKPISEVHPTYGFEYITYNIGKQDHYFARVLYVLPGSPAEEAGLKRDDWISGINGGDENITDYSVLSGVDALTVKIRKWDYTQGGWIDKGNLTFPAARVMVENPLFKDSVYVYGDRKIGYLVYNNFFPQAEGEYDGAYDNQMKALFAKFKAEGVNEFVLDLRFNGGGQLTCAILLSSLLAPQDALENNFCTLYYNSRENKIVKADFDHTVRESNLNLNRLYVLTGQFTASASEVLINGLLPYMGEDHVRIIGDYTAGKAVGSNPFYSEIYDWIFYPITFRIVNSEGKADYSRVGFTPDIEINEYASDPFYALYPLGDTREILLSAAIEEITGEPSVSKALRSDMQSGDPSLKPVYSSLEKQRENN